MAAPVTVARFRIGRLVSVIERFNVAVPLQNRKWNQFCQKHAWRFCYQNNNYYQPLVFFQKGFSSISNNKDKKKTVQFKLSDIGEGIREVNVKEWFVKVGDRVEQFDSICEVQSDKASVTITSRYDGIVTKLYHDIDDTALVGQPLVDIEMEGSEGIVVPSTDDFAEKNVTDESSSSSSSSDEEVEEIEEESKKELKILATPAVRHMAAEKKVNLQDVEGTGKHGRILKEDVLAYIKTKAAGLSAPEPVAQPKLKEEKITLELQQIPLVSRTVESPKDRNESIIGMRKAMVKSMSLANLVPHFTFCDEVNLSKFVDLKSIFKEVAQKYGIKFSYTSVFVKAASVALAEYPILNSSVDAECKTITYKGSHNIGVAMDSPNGLVVPNIKNVAQLSILEVASELNRLMQLGASGKLGLSDLTGGTFTLSNVGMIGGTYTKPVIFVPEVVIGALGSVMKLPRFDENDKVVPAHIMNVSWSADHRVIDGATMARFSNLWKSYLENPASLLLHLR